MRQAIGVGLAVFSLAAGAEAAERTYVVDREASSVVVEVGKAGLFRFAGHEHEVEAGAFTGEVHVDPRQVPASSVSLTFPAAALRVTGRGEPAADVPEVQATMLGPRVLDAAGFPEIVVSARAVSARHTAPGTYHVELAGELRLRGVTRPLAITARVELGEVALTATGEARLRQSDFGIRPVSAAGGTVKVKDELRIRFRVVARAAPEPVPENPHSGEPPPL